MKQKNEAVKPGRRVLTPAQKVAQIERASARVEQGLRAFKVSPDEAIVRLRVVAALHGISMPTLYRWRGAGLLPEIITVGIHTSGMRAGAVRESLSRLTVAA